LLQAAEINDDCSTSSKNAPPTSNEKVTTTTALSTERFRIPHLLSAATREE
jgi:hypothetical protein